MRHHGSDVKRSACALLGQLEDVPFDIGFDDLFRSKLPFLEVFEQHNDIVNICDGLNQRVFRQLTTLCDILYLRYTLIYIIH
jgi:hypothetical protein